MENKNVKTIEVYAKEVKRTSRVSLFAPQTLTTDGTKSSSTKTAMKWQRKRAFTNLWLTSTISLWKEVKKSRIAKAKRLCRMTRFGLNLLSLLPTTPKSRCVKEIELL